VRPHVKTPPIRHNLPFKKLISAKKQAVALCCYIYIWKTKKHWSDWTFGSRVT